MSIKISELPQASTVNNIDVIPIVQNGTTKKVNVGTIHPPLNVAVAKLNTVKSVSITTTGSVNGAVFNFDYLDINIGDAFSLSNGKIKINRNAIIQIDGYVNPYGITASTDKALGIVYFNYRNGSRTKIDGISSIANVNTMAIELYSIIAEVQANDEIAVGLFSDTTRNNIALGNANLTVRILQEGNSTSTRSLNLTKSANTGELVGTGDRIELTDETKHDEEQVEKQVENISEEKQEENQEENQNEAEPIEATKIETKTEGSGDSK